MKRVQTRFGRIPWQAVATIALLTSWFAAWFSAPVLFSEHEHVWCEEHRQFEHVGHDDSAHHDAHQRHVHLETQPDRSAHTVSFAAQVVQTTREHEACPILSHLNPTFRLTVQEIGQGLTECGQQGHLPSSHPHVTRSLLSLAPKLSPPTAI